MLDVLRGSHSCLAGCATFHPQPVSPEKTAATFDARSLANGQLRAFLETNHVTGNWPRDSWDLNALTLAAFYYQPALAEARAQWAAVEAAKITAGERPNPTVGFTPTYDTTAPPPWILGLTWDIPIETAGKRGKRIAQAEHLSEAAKWDFVGMAWKTRSNVRAALLAIFTPRAKPNRCSRGRKRRKAMSSGCSKASLPPARCPVTKSRRRASR